jgi:pullulanase/glycogen debranching enzyme
VVVRGSQRNCNGIRTEAPHAEVRHQGTTYPLGATLTPDGVNFAVYSQKATGVFLLLFDAPDGEPTDIIQFQERDKFIWHAHVQGIKPGSCMATRSAGNIVRNGDCDSTTQTAAGSLREGCDWKVSEH